MRAPDHLNALRAVEAAARHQSFALAAKELNVTPAAIGQLVRRLEETLGVALFHRAQAGPARLVATEAATAAMADLRAGFASLAAAMDRLRGARMRPALSVTVPMAFADKWLLPRLARFYRRHAECALQIDTSTALVDFTARAVDVGIRYGAGSWPGLVAVPFARDAFFPVCSPALVSGPHGLRRPEDLKQHALIHDTSMAATPAFPSWRTWYEAAGLDPAASGQGLRINDSAAAYRMAIAGDGVAMGRTTLVADDLREGRLVCPFGPELACPLAYHVVCRPQDADEPTIVALRDWLVEEAG
ncbi:LysR substrate-binding domain-containing protein [Sphingomonas morindae]|uniref:LysR family transcriptional regulator n=1 Tax=Sphingomonas morindae TaxID=1541170 RepID=A0ABY4X7A9_9SPHN|nr:LysR substrate-binding domain-containing protein [Sphingomonas morindae]USI72807.1 LysR family transcriptional regulator [Sphingomonas morindae]